ncbi:MAG: rod shape-determining protein MreD [Bacteroidetes bacterium]|nr:rod shape-determining protein MreD [Bacteroidota bacterium]MBS1931639.1 rod shape-determining protein MreD [Bacteroidota bacterium]
MSSLIRNMIRLALFLLIQVYVLNKIPQLHRFITPYLYYLFILWLPFSIPRIGLLLAGFLTGIILDYFTMTPGLHAAACVLIAYVRPYIIHVLMPKDISEFNYREPSPKAMGWTPYAIYIFILTILHHGYLVFLEWMSFGSFVDFIIKLMGTTAISLLLIFTVEFLFPRQLKYRTNVE